MSDTLRLLRMFVNTESGDVRFVTFRAASPPTELLSYPWVFGGYVKYHLTDENGMEVPLPERCGEIEQHPRPTDPYL